MVNLRWALAILSLSLWIGPWSRAVEPADVPDDNACQSRLMDGTGGQLRAEERQALARLHEAFTRRVSLASEPPWLKQASVLATGREEDIPVVMVDLTGPGNSGKSTLFNAIPAFFSGDRERRLGQPLSLTHQRSGFTQQMVLGVHPSHLGPEGGEIPRAFAQRFPGLRFWRTPQDSVEENGAGVIVSVDEFPVKVAVMDSPDFNTGNLLEAGPERREKALQAIAAADVLIYVISLQTSMDYTHQAFLNEAFALYGDRKMIVVYQDLPGTNLDDAYREVLRNANNIYYGDPERRERPPHLLAAYFMPSSSAVRSGAEHPQLVPLAAEGEETAVEFGELLRSLDFRHAEVKEFSKRETLSRIVAGASQELRRLQRQAREYGLIRSGLELMIQSLARDIAQPFPYDDLRLAIIREHLEHVPDAQRWLRQAERMVADPLKALRSPEIRLHTDARERGLGQLIERALDHFLTQVRTRVVQIPGPRLEAERRDLIARLDRFRQDFEADSGSRLPVPSGTTAIALPAPTNLPQDLATHLAAVEYLSPAEMREEIHARLRTVSPWDSVAGRLSDEYRGRIRDVNAQRGPLLRLRDSSTDLAVVGTEVGAGMVLYSYSGSMALTWLVLAGGTALVVPARVAVALENRRLESLYRRPLNDHFLQRQIQVVEDYLRQHILRPIDREAHRHAFLDWETRKQVDEALRTLDPHYASEE